MDKLLAKEEWRKYHFLKKLEQSSYFSLPKKELCDQLEISNYVLKSILEQLILDLEKFGLANEIQLQVEDPFIQLEVSGMANSQTLLEKYVEESLCFQLLCGVVKRSYRSANDFSERKLISYPIVYNGCKQLNDYLNSVGLEVKQFRLTGSDERNIRLFLTELFSRVYKNNFEFYQQSHCIFAQEKYAKLSIESLTMHQRMILKHFVYLTDLRIQQAAYCEISPSKKRSLVNDVNQNDHFFARVPQKFRENEVEVFLRYYYSRSEVFLPRLQQVEMPYVNQWSGFLLSALEGDFPSINDYPDKKEIFLLRTKLIHFQLLETSFGVEELQPEINIYYFQQNYPQVLSFCRIYLKKFIKKFPELAGKKKWLFFNYLLLILDSFPKQTLLQVVTIYVDFSFGSLYNRFIIENLSFFQLVGAEVCSSIQEADIVLTDSRELGQNHLKDFVIWLSPPRPLDWANLGERIIKKRLEKQLT
ncbi:helix-turn-helix domain-containing protein [Enterococcus thailandicus]|uniref:helix-turn-helix domain-containing protein n=1 Tax=Enterococcus thailandicus TaxID=417368 RepID=UPI0022EBF95D|nr:helix-turn-helix domain-containing protein [Enterococcus thailandicus]MDA3973165.1 helix-turn-helix domain-containing protein [Enterococcus thailandicus]